MNKSHLIGVISDTHGLLRKSAFQALAKCEHIIHAGDIGKADVLDALRRIAPVWAVRGNGDHGNWADELPLSLTLTLYWIKILVIHQLKLITLTPHKEGFHLVISGHSHSPSENRQNGVIYLNPGSAGPQRFNLPLRMARLRIDDTDNPLTIEWLDLSP